MKLTAGELRFLRLLAIRGKASPSMIGRELRMMRPQVSRILRALREKGFLETEKAGVSKTVSLSEAKHAAIWRRIALEFDHIPFDRLLSGATLEVLSAICYLKLRNRKEIRKNSLVSEPSIAEALKRLRQAGIVEKTDRFYSIAERFQILKEIVREFRHYLNQNVASNLASDALILWECSSEFIIESKSQQEEKGFLLTGISAFARFGIQLMAQRFHFFYSPFVKELRLEDALLHSILVDRGNMLPTLLVWKKNERMLDRDYLEERAKRYGLGNAVRETARYFASQGRDRPEGYPPWNEFELKAKEYEVL